MYTSQQPRTASVDFREIMHTVEYNKKRSDDSTDLNTLLLELLEEGGVLHRHLGLTSHVVDSRLPGKEVSWRVEFLYHKHTRITQDNLRKPTYLLIIHP